MVKCPRCNNRFDYLTKNDDSCNANEARSSEKMENRIESPWENREKIGNRQAIFETFKYVLFSPRYFFSGITYSKGITEPFAYGLLFGSIGSMFGFFWQFLVESMSFQSYGSVFPFQISQNALSPSLIIMAPLICILIMFITGITAHLCLMAVGGGGNGFEGTFRVVAFSQSAQLLGVIPFIGGHIGSIWSIITMIIGLKEIHETSYIKVILASFIPLVLIILIILMTTILSFSFLV